MNMIHRPLSEAEAADVVAQAHARKSTLAIRGGGTRAGLGRPVRAAVLDLSGLTGVTLYEPSEMVLSARAGTALSEIEALIGQRGQMLPFEPADHRRLYGSAGEPTIGAVAACNISGPRRIQAGAARDHLIGLRLVNGRGEIVKTGGRVMKNVTGLDLVKLNAGAHGTLGALTEATFKLLPRPERAATLAASGLSDAAAVDAMSRALGSPFEITGAAHLPGGLTLLRLEGFAESVDYRIGALRGLLGVALDVLALEEAARMWRDIRDAAPILDPAENAVWRISVAPSVGPKAVARLAPLGARWFYDWGGGLVWASVPAAANVRAALAGLSGHATLMRAPDAARVTTPVFEPLSEPVMTLTAGVKKSFDPGGVLNPGRMYEGI